ELHDGKVQGPFPHGDDRFAVLMSFDVTFKPTGDRMQLEEVGVFTVDNGKVTKEEFFYHMG
ncbi:MAG: nuclear transport factor 2 family protein, partial [Pseudomonadota bacterium]